MALAEEGVNPKLRLFTVTLKDAISGETRTINAIAPDLKTLVSNVTTHILSVVDLGNVDLMLIPTESPAQPQAEAPAQG